MPTLRFTPQDDPTQSFDVELDDDRFAALRAVCRAKGWTLQQVFDVVIAQFVGDVCGPEEGA